MYRSFLGFLALCSTMIGALVWPPGAVRAEDPEDQALYSEAAVAVGKRDWDRASAAADRWLEWRTQHYGAQSKKTGVAHRYRGEVYAAAGQQAQAIESFRRALEIFKVDPGPPSEEIGSLLSAIAEVQQAQGQDGEAVTSLRQALEIFEVNPGPETAETATCLNKLSLLLLHRDALYEAEQLTKRALKIREKLYGKQWHPDLAASLGNLGLLYFQLGAYEEAEEPLNRALDIYAHNANDSAYLLGASNVRRTLASVYAGREKLSEAEDLLQRVIDDTRKQFGNDSIEIADAMETMAGLQLGSKRFKEAEGWFTKALEIESRKLPADHETILRTRNSLAACFQYQGDYAKAGQSLEELMALCQKKLGRDHPLTITVTHNLGMNFVTLGEKKQARAYAQGFLTLLNDNLEKVLAYFPENRRLGFVQNMGFSPYDLVATLGDGPLTAEAMLTFNTAVLESVARDRRRALLARGSDDARLVEQINELRLKFLEAQLVGDLNRTKVLADRLDEKEKELSRRLRVEKTYRPLQQVAWEDVASRLPIDAVLLEFVFYKKHLGSDGGWRDWCGAVALSRDREPVFRELGPSDEVQKSIGRYLAVVVGKAPPIPDETNSNARTVYLPTIERSSSVRNERVFGSLSGSIIDHLTGLRGLSRNVAPIDSQQLVKVTDPASLNANTERACRDLFEKLISPFADVMPPDGAQLFICPDGQLSLVSFATLLDHDDNFIGSRFQVCYVDSGRVFLERSESPKAPSQMIALLGNPDFERSSGGAYVPTAMAIASPSSATPISSFADVSFLPLPGTAEEVEAIEAVFHQKGWRTRMLRGAAATEAKLRSAVMGATIVHLATHGYFVPEFDVGLKARISNPMFCGWLALTGANATLRAWQNGRVPTPANDGILMAAEVTGLDLSAAQLVVFSACDTGKGEARNGEGVLGLRRGVALAGARNLLLTTWDIDDQYAVKFMKLLYLSILDGVNAVAALHAIQASELTKLRQQAGTFLAVHYAGPFVVIHLKN